MEKQFVTYEIASQLKQLGFNEPCFGFYNKAKEFHYAQATSPDSRIIVHWCKSDQFQFAENGCIAAPLWQQAIEWLESVKRISVARDIYDNDIWYVYSIDEDGFQGRRGTPNIEYSKEKAILFALKRLIK